MASGKFAHLSRSILVGPRLWVSKVGVFFAGDTRLQVCRLLGPRAPKLQSCKAGRPVSKPMIYIHISWPLAILATAIDNKIIKNVPSLY